MLPIYRIETLLFSGEKRETLFSIEIIERLLFFTEKGVAVAVPMLWPNACDRMPVAVAMAVAQQPLP